MHVHIYVCVCSIRCLTSLRRYLKCLKKCCLCFSLVFSTFICCFLLLSFCFYGSLFFTFNSFAIISPICQCALEWGSECPLITNHVSNDEFYLLLCFVKRLVVGRKHWRFFSHNYNFFVYVFVFFWCMTFLRVACGNCKLYIFLYIYIYIRFVGVRWGFCSVLYHWGNQKQKKNKQSARDF